MTLYETTFIINPQTDDATIDNQVRQVAELIGENKGKIRFEDHMGTRRLAYEIQGLTQGYYASFIFEAPTTLLPVLERHYKLNESYVRHLTVRFEGDLDKMIGQADRESADTQAPAAEKTEAAAPEAARAETAPAEETVATDSAPTEEPAAEETKPIEVPAEAAAEETVEPETEQPAEESGPEDEEL